MIKTNFHNFIYKYFKMSQPNILHNFKSKNFDSRKYKFNSLFSLHRNYQLEKAIDLLTPKRKVSCHFLVDTNGQIYNLVSESKRLGMLVNPRGEVYKI